MRVFWIILGIVFWPIGLPVFLYRRSAKGRPFGEWWKSLEKWQKIALASVFPVLILLPSIAPESASPVKVETEVERQVRRKAELAESDRYNRVKAATLAATKKIRDDRYIRMMATIIKANKGAGATVIKSLALDGDALTATLVVSDAWYASPNYLRKRLAENSWAQWAAIASPGDPDKARIKLVSISGEALGGSDWQGSIIKIADD